MKKECRKFSASVKAKVAIEAITEASPIQELASKYQIDPTQVAWKRELLANAELVFSKEVPSATESENPKKKKLYSKIGYLLVQVDFLKKFLGEFTLCGVTITLNQK